MQALVTGCAGFIGSSLSEALIAAGHRVRGVDCFTSHYDPALKRRNLADLLLAPSFELVEADICTTDLRDIVDHADVVFHHAAEPGVHGSWSSAFSLYAANNVLAAQRLLEAVKETSLSRFVHASSSSVYGNAETYPTPEDALPRPQSPYGVTKLAAEHLCAAYADNYGVPTIALRYFTVYGPRQRPDMALQRLISSAYGGPPFRRYGDGEQSRDFTFVDDVVAANLAAGAADVPPGLTVNIARGEPTSLNELIARVADVTASEPRVVGCSGKPGDVRRTGGDIRLARRWLGWQPATTLAEGVRRQVRWYESSLAGYPE